MRLSLTTYSWPEGQPLPNLLPFPLYHGTSSVWVPSIREHGLGGRNIVEEFRGREFLRLAFDHARNADLEINPLAAQAIGWMLDQLSAAWNFRHGGLYLTPSRGQAGRYARHNPRLASRSPRVGARHR